VARRDRTNRWAACFETLAHRRNLAACLGGHVIANPSGQRIGVGNRCFPKPESNTNLRTDAFGRTAFQECFTIHRNRYVELPAQCRDPLRVDFGLLSWEAAAITEEGQQDGEAEPRFTALGHHQSVIGWRQSPRIVGGADALRHAARLEVAIK
jgi:hypothetical protein